MKVVLCERSSLLFLVNKQKEYLDLCHPLESFVQKQSGSNCSLLSPLTSSSVLCRINSRRGSSDSLTLDEALSDATFVTFHVHLNFLPLS